ncbi:hypothetical protein [Chelativorans sp. Marseille-P2723]|uniref:hypothetical protein n=1 Tax=Chelativorans sp. Marseille-P2723 TaxID=2709133 RepID=UPI0015710757|nr:hypothetical protein [Chelativorans sp. Marseille-P2723]
MLEEQRPSLAPTFGYLMLGSLFWAVHLLVVYAAHTLICALASSPTASSLTVVALTAILALPVAFVLLNQRRTGRWFGISDELPDRKTYDAISRFIGLLSLAGILWAGVAAAIVSSCATGR